MKNERGEEKGRGGEWDRLGEMQEGEGKRMKERGHGGDRHHMVRAYNTRDINSWVGIHLEQRSLL